MSTNWKQWIGRTVADDVSLLDFLGTSEDRGVYLTNFAGQKAAVKLYIAGSQADASISRMELAKSVSHPNILRIHAAGRCHLDGNDFVYAIMEFADENLAQVLPERPLTPSETREMLVPALDAMEHLHSRGLVLGNLKPANIMASGDQLKLASDGISRAGDKVVAAPTNPYLAPEANEGLSPQTDIWALGVVLVEVLTQKRPVIEGESAASFRLPAPFHEIAEGCLNRDPARRWSVPEIRNALEPKDAVSAKPGPVHSIDPPVATPASQPKNRKRSKPSLLAATLLGLALIATIALLRLGQKPPQTEPQPANSSEPAPFLANSRQEASEPITERQSELEPQLADAKPSAQVPRGDEARSSSLRRISDEPVYEPEAATELAAAKHEEVPSGHSGIMKQVLPDVPRKASNTIQGKVRVQLKVEVDRSGNVTDAEFLSRGPSKYFAKLAMDSARAWRFTPAQEDAREWKLQFDFRRSGVTVVPTELN